MTATTSNYVGGPIVAAVLHAGDIAALAERRADINDAVSTWDVPEAHTWALIGVDDEDELAALEFYYLSRFMPDAT